MRRTRQREAVLRALQESEAHPTADSVFVRVRAELPEISLGTVYRILNQLAGEGAVDVIDLPDAPARFDARPSDHQHVLCTVCGRLADVPELLPVDSGDRVEQATGYSVTGWRLLWRGLCPDCRLRA